MISACFFMKSEYRKIVLNHLGLDTENKTSMCRNRTNHWVKIREAIIWRGILRCQRFWEHRQSICSFRMGNISKNTKDFNRKTCDIVELLTIDEHFRLRCVNKVIFLYSKILKLLKIVSLEETWDFCHA